MIAQKTEGGFAVSSAARLSFEEAETSPLLAFSSRAGYVAWAASWRAAYAERAAGIRLARRARREAAGGSREHVRAAAERGLLRIEAFNLLVLRAAGRRMAARQYAARSGLADPALSRNTASPPNPDVPPQRTAAAE